MIENCVRNILNKTTHNIMFLTGPILFTNTLNAYLESDQNTYYMSDSEFNAKYSDKLRVYEIDMGKYAKYKHECVDNLYEGAHVYWQNEKTIYNNF